MEYEENNTEYEQYSYDYKDEEYIEQNEYDQIVGAVHEILQC